MTRPDPTDRPPLEFAGCAMISMAIEWSELAQRLGHAGVSEMLTHDEFFSLHPRGNGWTCSWVRFHDGACSSRRHIHACRSLAEVLRRMNEVEDALQPVNADRSQKGPHG